MMEDRLQIVKEQGQGPITFRHSVYVTRAIETHKRDRYKQKKQGFRDSSLGVPKTVKIETAAFPACQPISCPSPFYLNGCLHDPCIAQAND